MMGATLANGAVNPFTGERALPRDRVRDLLSVMYTCGMYDAAGQWAYEVGVPAKSGVSGGILAVIPGKGGIGVYSPGLDVYGNSVRGINVCYEIATHLGVHVFAADDEDALLGIRDALERGLSRAQVTARLRGLASGGAASIRAPGAPSRSSTARACPRPRSGTRRRGSARPSGRPTAGS